MKRILDGKRNLTDHFAERIGEAFLLSKYEIGFLKKLVRFNQAETPEERDEAFRELLKFKRFQALRQIEATQYEYYSHWYTSALFVALGTSWNEKSAQEMAKSLGIEVADLQASLRVLQKLGLVERKADRWVGKDVVLESAAETNSLNVRNFHRQILKRAIEALDCFPVTERDFQGVTIALSEKSYEEIKKKLQLLRQEISLLYGDDKEPKRLYQMHWILFPLLRFDDE